MIATQSDCDKSSYEEETGEEEVANLYLMAHENEVCSKNTQDFLFEELQETFYKLIDDLKLQRTKNKEHKKAKSIFDK